MGSAQTVRFNCGVAHLGIPGPVGIDVDDRPGGAGLGTLRVTAAQVALDHLAGIGIVVDGTEGAGNGAHLAAHTDRIIDFLRTGLSVDGDGLNRTGMQTPGFLALCAGVRDCLESVLKLKNLDS